VLELGSLHFIFVEISSGSEKYVSPNIST